MRGKLRAPVGERALEGERALDLKGYAGVATMSATRRLFCRVTRLVGGMSLGCEAFRRGGMRR